MSVLKGADSSVAQPELYNGREVWGIYVAGETPHVWSDTERTELGRAGVRGTLPIVVPSQILDWWNSADETAGYAYLESLVRLSGVPGGSPLVLDIEQAQAEKIGAKAPAVSRAWELACAAHSIIPWTYGGHTWHDAVGETSVQRWLADWETVPEDVLPAGFAGWQYEGGAEGGRIDLDLFAGGLAYLGPDGQVTVLGTAELPKDETAQASTGELGTAARDTTGGVTGSDRATESLGASAATPAPSSDSSRLGDAEAEVEHALGRLLTFGEPAVHQTVLALLVTIADVVEAAMGAPKS